MGKSESQARESRSRLVDAAGRAFRRYGYGGVGVDGVAKQAGLTSGSFYAHFGSKADVFRVALDEGLGALRDGIDAQRAKWGPGWLPRFAKWYFGAGRRADLEISCALPTLSLEAARADDATRRDYERRLLDIVRSLEGGLGGAVATRRARAWRALALLSGGMVMAHAVADQKLGAEIGRAMVDALRHGEEA